MIEHLIVRTCILENRKYIFYYYVCAHCENACFHNSVSVDEGSRRGHGIWRRASEGSAQEKSAEGVTALSVLPPDGDSAPLRSGAGAELESTRTSCLHLVCHSFTHPFSLFRGKNL